MGTLLEVPQGGASNEYVPTTYFFSRNKKNINTFRLEKKRALSRATCVLDFDIFYHIYSKYWDRHS